jgi:hypothetical protein
VDVLQHNARQSAFSQVVPEDYSDDDDDNNHDVKLSNPLNPLHVKCFLVVKNKWGDFDLHAAEIISSSSFLLLLLRFGLSHPVHLITCFGRLLVLPIMLPSNV